MVWYQSHLQLPSGYAAMGLRERPYNPLHPGGFMTRLGFEGYPLWLRYPSFLPLPGDRVGLARLFTSLVWHDLIVPFRSIMVTPFGPLGLLGLTTRDAPLPFPTGLTSLSLRDIPSHSHLAFTSLWPCPQRHGPAFNGVCSLFIWRMAPCESITLLLFGPLVSFLYCLRPYVAFLLLFSWPQMASFMVTTLAVPSLRLRLPCNLGIHYLFSLTASAFAVSGRFQPFLESWGCSLLSSACLSQHRSVDCVYSP